MEKSRFRLLCLIPFCFAADAAIAETQLLVQDTVLELSDSAQTAANKARLLRLQDGTLIVVWHQGHGSSDGAWGIDGNFFAPRDIFIRTSEDGGESWSPPVNISKTADLTDLAVFYDRTGDGTGLANFYGDSGKATVIASGNNLLVIWNDSYCGSGSHGPARYEGSSGLIQLPYRCLYAARVLVSSGAIDIMGRDRITDATRDVSNEIARATGPGFALAWQEDPQGLQPGEALGEGDGASGARVTSGTDVWYAWMAKSGFTSTESPWNAPVPISDNYHYESRTVISGGASRPMLALAGNPATAILVYEEAKDLGLVGAGKYVRYHQFPFSAPPQSQAGIIVSDPVENSRRARIIAASSPGGTHGTRLALMWRQGEGTQGAPADFMMRVGSVPAGTNMSEVSNAGFRVSDLSPSVDPIDPSNNAPGINLSAQSVSHATSVDSLSNAKAHRAVMDGDFIYAAYTKDLNANDGLNQYQFWTRWSDDGGKTWAPAMRVSAGVPRSENVIEPRLIRTPGTVQSGNPEDIRNPNIFVLAWGTEVISADTANPVRDLLFVTRTTDRGRSFERVQPLEPTRSAPAQTDEQIQLRVSPDGNNVAAVWVRRDLEQSNVVFGTALGITRTADLSTSMTTSSHAPNVGDEILVTLEIHNDGPQSATEPTLTVGTDSGLVISSMTNASGDCSITTGVICKLDDLAVGETAIIELELIAELRDKHAITAEITALEEEPIPANNVANLLFDVIPNADLSINIVASPEYVDKNDTFEVIFEVTNHGPQIASDVLVTFQLPSIAAYFESQHCNFLGNQLACSVPTLSVGESWSSTADFHATGSGIATISVNATATEVDPVSNNNAETLNIAIYDTNNIENDTSGGGGGGCVYAPDGGRDSTLPTLLVISLLWQMFRRQQKKI